ncbi:MAG TPA: antibiotic biosynthesis monooxygenase [Pyrinomonadaceae bacterium]|nr:antibiotic biosynthesis monooxygenase [Pyrinomonadaceae bacterium]
MLNENETTALVIEHRVRAGAEKRYEQWLGEILQQTKRSPGYLGREIFPPAAKGEPYIVIVRFQSENDLQTWLNSPERKEAISQMEEEFEDGDKTEIRAGIDVWFTPKNAVRKPPPYKQFILTAAAIYPLSLTIPRLLSPLFEVVPILKNPFLAGLIMTSIIVGLMTYVVMPFLTAKLHNWLFASEKKNKKI